MAATKKTKKKKSPSARSVPVVSDKESPARQRRNAEHRKGFASERSATGKWENESFADYSVDDLTSFLKTEDLYIHDVEARARRLLANLLNVVVGVVRDRGSATDGMKRVKDYIDWDERTYEGILRRYKRAKKAYRVKTGSKWTGK